MINRKTAKKACTNAYSPRNNFPATANVYCACMLASHPCLSHSAGEVEKALSPCRAPHQPNMQVNLSKSHEDLQPGAPHQQQSSLLVSVAVPFLPAPQVDQPILHTPAPASRATPASADGTQQTPDSQQQQQLADAAVQGADRPPGTQPSQAQQQQQPLAASLMQPSPSSSVATPVAAAAALGSHTPLLPQEALRFQAITPSTALTHPAQGLLAAAGAGAGVGREVTPKLSGEALNGGTTGTVDVTSKHTRLLSGQHQPSARMLTCLLHVPTTHALTPPHTPIM